MQAHGWACVRTYTHAQNMRLRETKVQPAGCLCLARCSQLGCQMNHLQITGVAITGEKNNTAAAAWEGETKTETTGWRKHIGVRQNNTLDKAMLQEVFETLCSAPRKGKIVLLDLC